RETTSPSAIRSDQCPWSSVPSSEQNTASESKRGMHSQSTSPSRVTSAVVRWSESRAWSSMSGLVILPVHHGGGPLRGSSLVCRPQLGEALGQRRSREVEHRLVLPRVAGARVLRVPPGSLDRRPGRLPVHDAAPPAALGRGGDVLDRAEEGRLPAGRGR